jgi:hypothetical protein
VLTLDELVQALSSIKGRVAIIIDTGVPSIDVPTIASLGDRIPRHAHVVLWGTDERQKKRLIGMFPQVARWVASGAAESAVDVLLDVDAR